MKGPRPLEIHIDQLVLHGFSHADRYPVADAVHQELSRLFAGHPMPSRLAQSMTIGRIDGGTFNVEAARPRESTGANVARAIYGGLRE